MQRARFSRSELDCLTYTAGSRVSHSMTRRQIAGLRQSQSGSIDKLGWLHHLLTATSSLLQLMNRKRSVNIVRCKAMTPQPGPLRDSVAPSRPEKSNSLLRGRRWVAASAVRFMTDRLTSHGDPFCFCQPVLFWRPCPSLVAALFVQVDGLASYRHGRADCSPPPTRQWCPTAKSG